jgi:RNA polymerase sigma factor (TIGR02999 family)
VHERPRDTGAVAPHIRHRTLDTPRSTVPDESEITTLLAAMRDGDGTAMDRLFPLVYRDIHERAHRQLAHRRPGDTLSTTALVHETYLKLAGSSNKSYHDRVHFFAVASRAMRQILVDYARRSTAHKRSTGRAVTLEPEAIGDPDRAEELVALDEGLERLARLDARLVRIVELRFFGGLSVEEAAEVLGISPRTVKRDWQKARAFLYDAIRDERHALS